MPQARPRSRQKPLLWGVVALCLLPTVIRLGRPELGSSPRFLALQQFAFGVMASVAAGATVGRLGARKPGAGGCDGQPPLLTPPAELERLYRTQRVVALVLGWVVIVPILVMAARAGRFQEFGGWVLLPMPLIGPALFLRDWLGRCDRTPGGVQR